LGYTAKAPKTAAEHNATYNKLTDDSLDAYNFLMGKGKNLTQRKAETRDRPVMQRYDEAVLGRKMPRLGSKTTTTDKKEVVAGDTVIIGGVDFDLTDPTKAPAEDNNGPWSWDITSKRWVQYGRFADGGLIPRRFAQGGISGEGNLNLNIPLDFGSAGGGGGGGGISLLGGAHSGPGGGFSGYNNTGSSGFGGTTTYTQTIGSTGPGGFSGIPEGVHSGMGGTKGVTATGPMLGGDYTSLNSDMMRHGGMFANGGMTGYAVGGGMGTLGSYSDGGRLLKGPGDGVSDSIPATIGAKNQPARLADGEFVIPARIVSELGNGSTDAGAKKLYAMMDRVQRARGKTTGKNKVAANSRSDKYLPA